MIVDRIDAAGTYFAAHGGFAAAFAFLARPDLADLPAGRHEIDGERVFALIEHPQGRGTAGARLEVHRRHIDIQVALCGREQIGWRPLADCSLPDGPFDESRDVGFFHDRPAVWLPLAAGQFMIFWPRDAHAPLAGAGPLHKVVVKLRGES